MNYDESKGVATKLERQMAVLYRVDSFMSTLSDLEQLLEQIMRESQHVTEAEASSLALYDEATDELYFDVALGEKGEETKKVRMKRGEGILGYVALTGEPLSVPDVRTDPRFANWVDRKTGFRTRCILAVPLKRRDRLIGVVEVLNKRTGRAFTDEDRAILEVLAHQAAIAIENARLYQENMEKERLASLGRGIAGAAHCIKNIVNLLSLGSGVVELGIAQGHMELVQRGWRSVQKGNERITDLVMDMLSYSKEQAPEYAPTSVNMLLTTVVDLVKPKAAEKGITVIHDLDSDIGMILLDEQGIHRCVMNLVSNAFDALESVSDGRIEIYSRMDRVSDEVEIRVSDNGCGIPSDQLERIFKVFYSTKGSRGTGLGLGVTKKIVLEHGGNIAVESVEGQGTTFSIRLPVRREV